MLVSLQNSEKYLLLKHTVHGIFIVYSQKNKIMASGPITSWQIYGETVEAVTDFIFGGSKITADGDCSHEIERGLLPWKKTYDQPRQHIKKETYHFANKGPSSQSYGFSSSHVWMWELIHKEGYAPKNRCFLFFFHLFLLVGG